MAIVHDRCQRSSYSRGLEENIGILMSKLQDLLNDYEQQWMENDHCLHFSCPVQNKGQRGRPRYVVPEV